MRAESTAIANGNGAGAPPAARSAALRAVVEEFRYAEGRPAGLRDIDLTVHTGELVVIAGPSGSGKSTLADALAGLIPSRVGGVAWKGEVLWQEAGCPPVDLSTVPLHEAAQHVGLVSQNPEYQLIQYRVDAEVAFGPENLALPHEAVVDRVHRSLATVGAQDLAGSAISGLSGGQKQRVAIAAALAMGPPMLVLDEPTSDLDPVGTDEVLQVLHRLCHEDGHGVVVVEHKLDEIAPYADRVLLVVDGQIIVDDHPRRAFIPSAPWRSAGVRPPELVSLCEALPEHFGGTVPLTVDEAAERLGASVVPEPAATAPPGPPAGDPVLALENVSVRFGDKVAVDDVTLRAYRGEWLAVVGANGSGKSTIGATLMGFNEPASGTAWCFGEPVVFGRIPKQAKQVGYLFQNVDDMLFCETVGAELSFTRDNRIPSGQDAPDPDQVAEFIGLTDRLDAHPYVLSGGERERMALGALLTRAPRGLILDEPTTGLDEAHAVALFELLTRVRTSLGSLTCVLITHDMRLVARFADRVAVVRDGRVVLDTTPQRAFAEVDLLESAGVRPPPIAALHSRLAVSPPAEVVVSVEELLPLLRMPVSVGGRHVAAD